MSPQGRPKGEYRSAQHEGTPVSDAAGAPRQARIELALGALGALLGGLVLIGWAFDIGTPGRMSPATAFCFLAIAAALALLATPQRQHLQLQLQLPLAAALSAAVLIIALLFLAAHVSNRLLGLRWGGATTMALHTTIAFLALGLAALLRARRLQASRWALGRIGTAGFVLGVVLMLGAAELASTFAFLGLTALLAGLFFLDHGFGRRQRAERALQQLNAELEQQVAQRTAQLEAKTRELEGFCYSVSHDLKAPLRGIDGYSRLLVDEYGGQLDAEGRMFVGNVRKATTQMTQLIEDLLTYSRQERRALVPTQIGLRAFVDEQLARRATDLADARVSVDVDDLRVSADREGLAMALRNVIDNALKFSARAVPAEIAIRGRRIGERCVLSVQDNGTGFDMRYYGKIFEIFQRLHRA